MDRQLVAIYELKRQTFLLGYLNNPRSFSDALAFAYLNRVAPILHENIARETHDGDPFDDVYAVKGEFVERVLTYVDQQDLAGNYGAIEFYNLEDHFGGRGIRVELIHALEYIRIDRRFNQHVWDAIERNSPAEANNLQSEFKSEHIDFN